jgi:3-oxoacyl-[acyl-carrier protein] reductase
MLAGKKVLVTGASGGIGRAIARACAQGGAVVGVNFRTSADRAEALRAEDPAHYRLVPFDVRDPEAVEKGISAFTSAEGGLDSLVNCAGVVHPELLANARSDSLRDVLETNLLGALFCARAALPSMIRQKSGVILNISSVAALHPARGQAAYAASKAGLEALTRALAAEYGRKGIRAVGLRVGPVETPMFEGTRVIAGDEVLERVPLRRFGQPSDIGKFAAFLLSDKAGWVTGSIHTIDGGYVQG